MKKRSPDKIEELDEGSLLRAFDGLSECKANIDGDELLEERENASRHLKILINTLKKCKKKQLVLTFVLKY